MVNIRSVVRPSSNVAFQNVEGETVLLNLDSGQYYGLEPVGTRIWSLLQTAVPLSQIVEQLAGEFDVERSLLQSDTLRLIQDLKEAGLVHLAEPE